MSEKTPEEVLEEIEPTQDDFIGRRINHQQFARLIFWLDVMSKKKDFVYASELANFMKYTQTRAYSVLRDLCRVDVLIRKHTGNLVEFHFCRNGNKPIVNKYVDMAKKTLDLN